VNKGVLVILMAGVGIGMALCKAFGQKQVPQTASAIPAAVPVVGHRLADRLRGFLEVERN
jgi:hypothetical protein